jgi:hypothetical protein
MHSGEPKKVIFNGVAGGHVFDHNPPAEKTPYSLLKQVLPRRCFRSQRY